MNSIITQFTGTELQIILQLLHETKQPMTIRGIARTIKKSYPLIHQAVQKLKKKKIINILPAPPAHIISIRKDAPKDSIIIAEIQQKELFLQKYSWMHLFIEDVTNYTNSAQYILLVFGSYAKRTNTKNSDIDILFIVPEQKHIQILSSSVLQAYTPVQKHSLIITEKDFTMMIQNSETFNVGNEARKDHIILIGTERYYQLLTKRGNI